MFVDFAVCDSDGLLGPNSSAGGFLGRRVREEQQPDQLWLPADNILGLSRHPNKKQRADDPRARGRRQDLQQLIFCPPTPKTGNPHPQTLQIQDPKHHQSRLPRLLRPGPAPLLAESFSRRRTPPQTLEAHSEMHSFPSLLCRQPPPQLHQNQITDRACCCLLRYAGRGQARDDHVRGSKVACA